MRAPDSGLSAPALDVTSVSGLVSLTIDCMKDGLSDEAAILQRHLKSPDFGHPLLRLASPTSTEVWFPHMPDEDEVSVSFLYFIFDWRTCTAVFIFTRLFSCCCMFLPCRVWMMGVCVRVCVLRCFARGL